MGTDPQQARLQEILERVECGNATEAEREELLLYDEAEVQLLRDQVQSQVVNRALVPVQEDNWMERVAGDKRIKAAESTRFVRIERAFGFGLVAAGYLTGGLTMIPGFAILLWSFARVRLRTHKQDPYSEVEE